MRVIKKGATSQSIYVEILDSASTTGGRKTGIAYNTASLVGSYTRNGAARTAISLVTQTASGAYSSGGFVEVDATNVPGVYRLDVPDAAFAAGSGDSVVITLKGAAGMVQVSEEVQLVAVDLQDATAFGLSRIDAAITSRMATFSLPTNFATLSIDGSGRVDLGKWIGTAPNAVIQGRVDSLVEVETGTAQSGSPAGITLRAGASGTADFYTESFVVILAGTGAGQARRISGYNGSTKVATVPSPGWATQPDNTSVYAVIPFERTHVNVNDDKTGYTASTVSDKTGYTVSTVSDKTGYSLSGAGIQAIWDALTSALTTVGSIGKRLADDIDAAISSRSTSTAAGTALTAVQVENAVWDATMASHLAAGSTGIKLNAAGAAGDPLLNAVPGGYSTGTAGYALGHLPQAVAGGIAFTWTVYDTTPGKPANTPLPGVTVWATTDSTGNNLVVSGLTSVLGVVVFTIPAGTYYIWQSKPGYNFTNPVQAVVS